MAIKFLDSITLETNEIQNVAVENLATDPTAAADKYSGRIIFNTSTDTLKYYDGSAWINLDGTGNVDSVTGSGGLLNAGTAVDVDIRPDYTTAANIVLSAAGSGSLVAASKVLVSVGNTVGPYSLTDLGAVINPLGVSSFTNVNGTFISATTVNTTAVGAVTMGTIDLSAGGTASGTTFLRGDNVWATPAGSYTSWQLQGDGGTPQDIIDGGEVQFVGGTAITTAVTSGTPDTLTITHDNFGTAGTYAYPSAIVTNAQGHVTSVTAGSAPTDTTYTLPVTTAASNAVTVSLTDNSSNIPSTLSFTGVNAETTVTSVVGNNQVITIGLTDDVTIANDLTVAGDASVAGNLTGDTGTFTGLVSGITPTANANFATKEYVDGLVVGGLVFKGAYNAATNSPALEGASNIASTKGDTYVVDTDGTFIGEQVRVGDVIIVNENILANTNPALSKFTVVQANVDLASNTTVGLAKFTTANGFKGSMTAGEPALPQHVEAVGNGFATSYVVTHSLGTRQVSVEVYDNTTYETVQCKVVRTSTSVVTVSTANPAASSGLTVLVRAFLNS
jgi:hypothetical protein